MAATDTNDNNRTIEKNQLLYILTIEDLQGEALERIGRKLTYDEIEIAKDRFEWGFESPRDIVYDVLFKEEFKKRKYV